MSDVYDMVTSARISGMSLICGFCGKKISTDTKDTHRIVINDKTPYHKMCLNEKKLLSVKGSKKPKSGKKPRVDEKNNI